MWQQPSSTGDRAPIPGAIAKVCLSNWGLIVFADAHQNNWVLSLYWVRSLDSVLLLCFYIFATETYKAAAAKHCEPDGYKLPDAQGPNLICENVYSWREFIRSIVYVICPWTLSVSKQYPKCQCVTVKKPQNSTSITQQDSPSQHPSYKSPE